MDYFDTLGYVLDSQRNLESGKLQLASSQIGTMIAEASQPATFFDIVQFLNPSMNIRTKFNVCYLPL